MSGIYITESAGRGRRVILNSYFGKDIAFNVVIEGLNSCICQKSVLYLFI